MFPKIVLSDSAQIGAIPDLSRFFDDKRPVSQLFLFFMNCQSLELDGLTFEMEMTRDTCHSLLATNAKKLKVTNCWIADRTPTPHGIYAMRSGYCVVAGDILSTPVPGANIYWIENVIVDHFIDPSKPGPGGSVFSPGTVFSFSPLGGLSSHLILRNTAFAGNILSVDSKLDGWLSLENSTIVRGRLFVVQSGIRTVEVKDNVFVLSDNPIIANPPESLNTINVIGGNNAVWSTNVAITEANRNEGFLRWLPGPVMKGNPELDNNFQLKKSRKSTGLSEEDGAVGFRVDRIANFENILKDFEKNKRGK